MVSKKSLIIEGLQDKLEKLDRMANESKVTEDDVPDRKQFIVDEDKWITIKGTHVLTDDDGNIKNEKLKDKIEGNNSKNNDSSGTSSRLASKIKNTNVNPGFTAEKEGNEASKSLGNGYEDKDKVVANVVKKHGARSTISQSELFISKVGGDESKIYKMLGAKKKDQEDSKYVKEVSDAIKRFTDADKVEKSTKVMHASKASELSDDDIQKYSKASLDKAKAAIDIAIACRKVKGNKSKGTKGWFGGYAE